MTEFAAVDGWHDVEQLDLRGSAVLEEVAESDDVWAEFLPGFVSFAFASMSIPDHARIELVHIGVEYNVELGYEGTLGLVAGTGSLKNPIALVEKAAPKRFEVAEETTDVWDVTEAVQDGRARQRPQAKSGQRRPKGGKETPPRQGLRRSRTPLNRDALKMSQARMEVVIAVAAPARPRR